MTVTGRIVPNPAHPDPGLGTDALPWPETVTGKLHLPASSDGDTGVIFQNGYVIFHSYGNTNLFFGDNVGNFTLTGNQNIIVGDSTGQNLTSGIQNCFYGYNAGRDCTEGSANGMYGRAAGRKLTTGNYNTAVGHMSMHELLTGSSNTGIGQGALYYNSTGNYNTALGEDAGLGVQTGSSNVFIGRYAGRSCDPATSQRLYIAVTNTESPLIYGEFDNGLLRINGDFEVTGTITGASGSFIPYVADGYIIVEQGATALENGTNLLAAVNATKLLTPGGSALAADNRAVTLVPPGVYDLGSDAANRIQLDTEFCDLIGLSSNRDDVIIKSSHTEQDKGVIHQTANDVRIENMTVWGVGGSFNNPVAYQPDEFSDATVIQNVVFKRDNSGWYATAWRRDDGGGHSEVNYEGLYIDVKAEHDYSMGGCTSALPNIVSGTFIRCQFGNFCAGGGRNAICSGLFVDCSGGNYSMGGNRGCVVTGTFVRCVNTSWGFGGTAMYVDATVVDCETGDYGFGAWSGLDYASWTPTRNITFVNDDGSGKALITSSNHQMESILKAGLSAEIEISGTTSYNGTQTVLSTPTENTFVIDAPYVGNETGTWTYPDGGIGPNAYFRNCRGGADSFQEYNNRDSGAQAENCWTDGVQIPWGYSMVLDSMTDPLINEAIYG